MNAEDTLTRTLQAEGPDEFPEGYYRHLAREQLARERGTRAAVAIVQPCGASVGYADEGIQGYTPTTLAYGTYAEADAAAKHMNVEVFGLTEQRALEIVLSTMDLRKWL